MSALVCQEQKKIVVPPLLSWDVYHFHLDNIKRHANDFRLLESVATKLSVEPDLIAALEDHKVIVITDVNLNIEFASSNMHDMSGYLPVEMIGNSPKMLQGPLTDQKLSKEIRNHITKHEPFEGVLTNYRKDKSIYNCHIKGYPIFDKRGNITKFVAIEEEAA